MQIDNKTLCGRDILTGLIVVILWGFNFVAMKVGLKDVPPFLLAALRFLVATIPAIFFLPRPPVTWRWLIALGLTINAGQFAFSFLGMKLGMPAGLSSLVLQAQAFFTFIVAVTFLKEQWYWNNVLGLILAAVGMAIIGTQKHASVTVTGFWLTLVAAASWGIGNIILRRITQEAPPFSMLALVVWAGAIAILPLTILSWLVEGSTAWKLVWHSHNLTAIASVIYLSYFGTLGGYGLWGKLLAKYPAAVVSPFALLVPIVGVSSSVLLLGEVLSIWQIIGMLLVMSGLVVHVFGKRYESAKNIPETHGENY